MAKPCHCLSGGGPGLKLPPRWWCPWALLIGRVVISATGRNELTDRLVVSGGAVGASLAFVAAALTGGGVWIADGAAGTLSLLVAGSTLGGLVAGMMLGGRIGRRLSRLAVAAQSRTGFHDAAAAFRLEGEDAAGRLGRSVAELLDHLGAGYDEMERHSRDLVNNAERVAQLGSACRDLIADRSEWSEGFHAILGLTPGQCQPSPEVFLDCVHPADRDKVWELWSMVLAGGAAKGTDFRVVRPDGEIRTLYGRSEVVRASSGQPIRINSTIQDIGERKRLEDELDGLIRELWRSNEELEQFAYVASHDLRQPLRVVGSYVSLMEEDLQGHLTGETEEYMAFVRDGVRRMDRLITDLLTYSRVGRTSADRPVSIADSLGAAMADLQFEIEDAGAVIRILDPLPTVMGDESEMERLFQNLLGNAIKYRRPDRSPDIRVACADLGGAWGISVADNGIGIPPEHAERVFGIFQRLHARDEFEGTGVGLAIVKKIVERHGGSIRVQPAEGGAVLALTWPKMRPVVEEN